MLLRRSFIKITSATVAGVSGAVVLPSFVSSDDKMLRIFRRLRKSRAGLQPDIAINRLDRTIADLRLAGCEIEELHPTESEWRRWRAPVGFNYSHRCDWHLTALAGPVPDTDDWKAIPVGGSSRKLRCIICETEELHPRWFNHPVLLHRQFLKIWWNG